MRERVASPASAKESAAAPQIAARPAALPNRAMAKLRVGPVDDPLEREADRVADAVVNRALTNPGQPAAPNGTALPAVAQRKCAKCEDEERAQRKEISPASPTVAEMPSLGSGASLPVGVRQTLEPGFGYDFSGVRVHTGAAAQESARGLNARAYTMGRDVVFGAGEFAPETRGGLHLLAHELTHVVQQDTAIRRRVIASDTKAEIGGTTSTASGANAAEILGVVRTLCGGFTGSGSGGDLEIQPSSAALCSTGNPASGGGSPTACQCLCGITAAPTVWTLSLDDEGTPRTLSTDPTATNQVHEVHVPSASSDIAFGSWGKSGKRVTAGQAVILGHELCGHAARIEAGTHPADQCQDNGRPDHASTVAIENQIGKELFGPGFEERGSFTDPHQGESFGRFTLTGFNTNRVSAASLPGDMQQRLDHASRILKRPPANHAGCVVAPGADVIGHGDHQGSDASNVTVSTQRAGSVRQALINRGVPASRIKFLTGRGEAECPPCVGPDPDCADPGCRKVEVFVFGFPASSEASP